MEKVSIGAVARAYDISTRTLRYYDEIGLLPGRGDEDSAYRAYDEEALSRLRQILVLRRLGVPLKRVQEMLTAQSVDETCELMRRTMRETEHDIYAATALRNAQRVLLDALQRGDRPAPLLLDAAAQTLFPSLSVTMKEEWKMSEIKLEMTHPDRTVFLPPMVVASSRAFGREPENAAFAGLEAFIRSTRLNETHPDFRIFGFNNPSEPNEKGEYGYEFWVTIPADMDVPAPLTKREFCGGLYLAHCIKMGDFHEWQPFYEHAKNSDEYRPVARMPEGMFGWLEEHLNAYATFLAPKATVEQLDLLIPVERK